jgi:hypothetical protein
MISSPHSSNKGRHIMADNHTNEIEDIRTRWVDHQTLQFDCADGSSTEAAEGSARLLALIGEHRLKGRGNAPVRAATIQSVQKARGNRAVQRFVQRTAVPTSNSNTSMRVVQRYHRPDEDWLANTLESGQGMAGGMLGAIPILGNVMNASMAALYTGGSAINYATGHEDDAKRTMGYAQNSLLNAIPIFGNIRSGAQGVHDAGAFYENMFGSGSAPPEISRDIYARESGPILNRYLSSLF